MAGRCEIRVLLRYRIIIERRRRQLLKKRKLNGAVMRSRRISVYLLDSIYFATNFSSQSQVRFTRFIAFNGHNREILN